MDPGIYILHTKQLLWHFVFVTVVRINKYNFAIHAQKKFDYELVTPLTKDHYFTERSSSCAPKGGLQELSSNFHV